ncbi:toll-like receptor 4 [Mytilus californianus]|uniref:toll-like receptor 4 n=1 Tax=Mytilus californianus TaxID=6549 RepID=UPI002245F353|nr:toll-like receptor 4 [Mytilus californianus]
MHVKVDCSGKNITDIPALPENISRLNLQHNSISEIQANTFLQSNKLIGLDLSFNEISSLMPQAFIGLISLLYLNLDHNKLNYSEVTLPKGVFKPLVSLTHLSIKFNIDQTDLTSSCFNLPSETIADLLMLETIELDASSKTAKHFGEGFSHLLNLHFLYIGQSFVLQMLNSTFEFMTSLRRIFVKCAKIEVGEGSFAKLKQLNLLSVEHDSIFKLNFIEFIQFVNQLRTIETFILTNALISDSMSLFPWDIVNLVCRNTPLRELYITHNGRYEWDFPKYPTSPSPRLKVVDFSYSKFVNFGLNLTNVRKLILRYNTLGKYFANNGYMKSNESRIEHIDLSYNSIYKLYYPIFHGQPNLQNIDLSGNLLREISFDLSYSLSLESLNLSGNYIMLFPEATMRNLDTISKYRKLTVDLSHNDLQCSCSALSFLLWIRNGPVHFHQFEHYKCSTSAESLEYRTVHDATTHLQKECINTSHVLAEASSLLIIMLGIIIGAIVYRQRWKLRYMFYSAKSKYKKYKAVADVIEYTYDAFISYSEDDRSFVLTDFIEKLEKEENLSLCINHRDFVPGDDITDNIINAIQKSRKTICIISKSFFDSYYCMFEFNMARMEGIHSRNGLNVIFLVLYKHVRSKDIPLVIYELIQNQSYIEYPDDPQDTDNFWAKVKEAVCV